MKFLAFFSLAFPMSILVSLIAKAEAPPAERGYRMVSSLEMGKAERLTVSEHPQDDGNLRLEFEDGMGRKIQNDSLIGALDRNEKDVSSYNVSLKPAGKGAMVISSLKDWGASNWSYDYTITASDAGYVVSGFDYSFSRRKKEGKCSLNLLSGRAIVNGRKLIFSVPKNSLELADGLELEKICQELGAI